MGHMYDLNSYHPLTYDLGKLNKALSYHAEIFPDLSGADKYSIETYRLFDDTSDSQKFRMALQQVTIQLMKDAVGQLQKQSCLSRGPSPSPPGAL